MIIIPARLASTRFPQKVLAPINGIPMVIATARRVSGIDEVCIATDSQEVITIAKSYGIEAVLTRADHQSGTDRIDEAATLLGLAEDEYVVNVQADEPFIEPEIVEQVFAELRSLERDFVMASCYRRSPKSSHAIPILSKSSWMTTMTRSTFLVVPSHMIVMAVLMGIKGISGFMAFGVMR